MYYTTLKSLSPANFIDLRIPITEIKHRKLTVTKEAIECLMNVM